MPTTNHPAASTESAAIHISGVHLTRHVARLLEVRDRLALYATERASHNLDDAHDAFMAMVAVEDEIAVQAPKVHAGLFAAWATGCDAAGHEPGAFNARCGICRGANASIEPSRLTVVAKIHQAA
ncbi:hypothetical protein [Cellulomonas sp. HD19AZ1]|uniref:hypothetical protein n=1 Tax=Cellulomonas sp. HD19AZ1 TaxID=2559593 RepID=UPI0010714101|nr:hypothetical protein [Cellulomonas sp. HD19AZ1]TFH68199.1 hypothetical protein E4A51_16930 [Cellulomonas sp. HD19AZ1]